MATFASIRVSRIVHHRLVTSIMASSFRWLDQTPVSRIISRYGASLDMHIRQLLMWP
jgi:hypothetical protein